MRFYNRTRGPLSFNMTDGVNILAPPKSYVDLDPSTVGSTSINDYIEKGFLVPAAWDPPSAALQVQEVVVQAPPSVSEEIHEEVSDPKAKRRIGLVEISPDPAKAKVAGRRKPVS